MFYTLYKLANQTREKFGAMTLNETREIDWTELREHRKQLRSTKDKVFRGEGWTFDQVHKVWSKK